MDPDLGTVSALAVSGDTIVDAGDQESIISRVGPDTVTIDLGGRAVIPGFVDAHTHLLTDTGGVDQGQPQALESGITTLAEGFVDRSRLDTLVDASLSGDLILRTNLYLVRTDNCGNDQGLWYEEFAPGLELTENVRVAGVKIFSDGGTCGPIAASQAYLEGAEIAPPFHSDVALQEMIGTADAAGYQILIHAIGDAAITQVMDAYESVLDGNGNPLRHRIDHNSIVTDEMVGRYGEIGLIPVLFGWLATCSIGPGWTDFWLENGEEARAVIDANPGTVVAWHGDDPWVGPVSPLMEMFSLTTRVEIAEDGTVCSPPPEIAEDVITIEEALGMMTTGSAYALGLEDRVGSLTPGKLADFVVLDRDLLETDPLDLPDVEVLATFLGGEAVYCKDADVCESASSPSRPAASDDWVEVSHDDFVRVRASMEHAPVELAVDGDTGTSWQADSSPQWIELDLGEVKEVNSLRLMADQSPDGFTIHELYGGMDPEPTDLISRLEGETAWGDWIEFEVGASVRYLRVLTVDSPSWVAWLEIEVD